MIRFRRREVLGAVPAGAAAMLGPATRAGTRRPSGVTVIAHAKAPGTPLAHFWSRCVGAGRANEGLRADWQAHLSEVHGACGFAYCRFHGLFHDDMFVYHEENGEPRYNWLYVDTLFDAMLERGVRPFVELGFLPKAMASSDGTTFWWKGNVSAPNDFARWGELIGAAVRHWIARYGASEVRRWYFEVWNEPNLNGFWRGTRQDYFDLYAFAARAIKAVDPALRVGGPATSNFVGDSRFNGEVEDKAAQRTNKTPHLDLLPWHGVWIEAFLEYCDRARLPVDFVSTHPYPTDFALDPGTGRNRGRTRGLDATRTDLTWLRDTVRRSAFPDAELHCTEWSSSPSSRDHMHDALPAAAFILKTNLDSIGLVDSLAYWTFTDIFEEAGAGPTTFHGGFGMLTVQGIAKPSFHAYRMLHSLGDMLLARVDGVAVTRHGAGGPLAAIAYHFPAEVTTSLAFGDRAVAAEMEGRGTPRDFAIELAGLPPGASVAVERLDAKHGNARVAWEAMGAPEPPTREQTSLLRTAALAIERTTLTADVRGRLRWSGRLDPWACVLLKQER